MRTIAVLATIILLNFNVFAQIKKGTLTSEEPPKIKWDTTFVDLGTIKIHKTAQMTFSFENIGDKPILIYNAKGSCGCTDVEYPQKPILPGEKAQITVKFTPSETGKFEKEVYIYTNMYPPDDEQILKFKGKTIN